MVYRSRFVFLLLLPRFWGDPHLSEFPKILSATGTMREDCIRGYKPIDESVGLLPPGLQARIVRENGTDGGIREHGKLWVEGDCTSGLPQQQRSRYGDIYQVTGWALAP